MIKNYNSLNSATWFSGFKNRIGDGIGSLPVADFSVAKCSWLVMLFVMLCSLTGQHVAAQSITNYVYSTNVTSSLVDMSSGTTELSLASAVLPNSVYHDDDASPVTTFPFTFVFMGNAYDRFSVNSNGQMKLGNAVDNAAIAGTNISSPSLTFAYLCPLTGDNAMQSTGKVHYKVTGSPGNRILVVEWIFRIPYAATPAAGTPSTMQVLINEATGVVQYIYGEMYNNGTLSNARSVALSSSNTATTSAYIANIITTPTFTASGSWTTTSFIANNGMVNLNSTGANARRTFLFTPNVSPVQAPTALAFANVASTAMTLNWTAPASTAGIFRYAIFNSTDGGATYNFIANTNVGVNTYTATGLTMATSYKWRVVALGTGVKSANLDADQATNAPLTYYWVGGASGTITGANWNTDPTATTGVVRTDITDTLIIDGPGASNGPGNGSGAVAIILDAAYSIGQLKVTNASSLTLQAATTASRTLTISGLLGDDLVVGPGSALLLNTPNPIILSFSGSGNVGNIEGELTIGGNATNAYSASNCITTIASTGVVNNSNTNGGITNGSLTSVVFANGSNFNSTGTLVGMPIATWGASSNITITGATGASGFQSGGNQAFGNFYFNVPTSVNTFSAWTSSSAGSIQGNLTINVGSTGSAKFRALTTGNLVVSGNLNIIGGVFEAIAGNTGVFTVNGNVNISGGSVDIAASGTGPNFRVLGNIVQTGGTITQTAAGGQLTFLGTTAQTVTLMPGAHGTNVLNIRLDGDGGVNLTNNILIKDLTVFKGNITGTGSVSYGAGSLLTYSSSTAAQTATANEFPAVNGPASLTVNNSFTTNTLTIPFSRTLGAAGVLTLTNGILDNSGYVLTVPNPVLTAIAGTFNATKYVKGAIARAIPANYSTASNWVFPVGKAAYNPFTLVNPTTNADGTVTVQAEVFDANAGGAGSDLIDSINPARYWAASVVAGGANLTGTLVQLNDARGTFDAVATSSTLAGAYALAGGVTPTLAAGSITTVAPALTALPGYFAMALKASASISALAITPTGNQCTNVARTVTATVIAGGGAIATVKLYYQVNGGPAVEVNMTNAGGDNWTGIIPVVSPVNANVTWSITATDVNSIVKTLAGTPYNDAPLLGAVASASASSTATCYQEAVVLVANVALPPVSIQIGSGLSTVPINTSVGTFYGTYWGNARNQILITAAELQGAGFVAGDITGLSVDISALGSHPVNNFTIKIGATTVTAISGAFQSPSFSTVWGPTTYTPTLGINTHTFTTPFAWDGTSNIIVDYCFVNGITGSRSAYNTITTTAFGSFVNYNTDGSGTSALAACTSTSTSNSSSNRPNIKFHQAPNAPLATISWSDGSNTIGTVNNLSVSPTVTTTYTATVTTNGCEVQTSPVTITVSPFVTAPTAHNDSHCGTQLSDAYVTDNNAFTTPTYNWYAAETGGVALQSATSATYTQAVGTTTTFYVSVVNPTTLCESARTPVVITVAEPIAMAITQGATASVCQNASLALNAESTNLDYVYTWTATPSVGSGIATSMTGAQITVTPTIPGTYIYKAEGSFDGCVTNATITVTVVKLPTIAIASTVTGPICAGSAPVTLTATSGEISEGAVTIGGGAATLASYGNPYYYLYGGHKSQIIYTKAQLNAAGITAGNISALAFEITALGSGSPLVMNGFTINIGHTTQTVATSAALITTGLTQVYSNAAQGVAVGVNNYSFSTAFNWNNTDNIVVSICWSNNNGGGSTSTPTVLSDTTPTAQMAAILADNTPVSSLFAATTNTTSGVGTTSQTRVDSVKPKITFTAQIGTSTATGYAWLWDNEGETTNAITVSPSITTTYTVKGINVATGCEGTSQVTVTVNPKPIAPIANSTTQCGAGVPLASVTNPAANTFANPLLKWYATAVSVTPVQTGGTTYATSVSETITFHVSVTDPLTGCESNRTPVTVTFEAPPAIAITPATVNPCVNTAFTLQATSSAAYTYTWTAVPAAGSGILTSITGSDVSITPTLGGTYVYTISGTDGVCTTTTTKSITVISPTVNASASVATLCVGTPTTLTATTSIIASATANIGSGTTTSSTSAGSSPFYGGYGGVKTQYLIRASELTAAGVQPGNITSLAVDVVAAGATLNGFAIGMTATALTALTSSTESSGTSVYAGTFVPTVGMNTFNFSAPFAWNGTSNVIVTFCWSNNNASNTISTVRINSPGFTSGNARYVDNRTPEVLCPFTGNTTPTGWNGASTSIATRPNFVIGGQVATQGVGSLVYTWNPGGLVGSSVTVTPGTTTIYTVSAFDSTSGCTATKEVTVNVNVIPVAPTAHNATQCGVKPSLAYVSDNNAFVTPIFKWYANDLATNTTPLQATTAATYSASISQTTTFYVSVVNPTTGCESTRTPVTATFTEPAAITLASTRSCNGESLGLSATSANANYVYTWTASPVAGSGIASSIVGNAPSVVPTTAGTYVYTASANDGNCTITNTISVTVTPAPVAITASASATSICMGTAIDLSSTSGNTAITVFSEGFESPLVGWTYRNASPYTIPWQQAIPVDVTMPHSGSGLLFGRYSDEYDDNDNFLNSDNWIITPGQSLQANIPYTVSYWYRSLDAALGYTASLKVTVGTGTTVAAQSTTLQTHLRATNSQYVQVTVTYTPTVSGTYYFGFHNYTDYDEGSIVVDDFLISAPATPTYAWTSLPEGFTSNVQNPTGVIPTVPTRYIVTATFGGCSKSSFVDVVPKVLPVVNANNLAICKGTPGLLTATGDVGNAYTWTPTAGLFTDAGGTIAYTGGAAPSVYANPVSNATYTVHAVNSISLCSNTHEVTVIVNNPGSIVSATPFRFAAPGQNTTFAVTTSTEGSPTPVYTYRWQVNTPELPDTGWVNVPDNANYDDVATATLKLINIPVEFEGNLYRCVVTPESPCAQLISNPASLTISETGVVANTPEDFNICISGTDLATASFTVETSGEDAFLIEWQMSTDNGATFNYITDGPDAATGLDFSDTDNLDTKTLVVNGITSTHNGYQFQAIVNFGVSSDIATLHVNTPVLITTAPAVMLAACQGGSATLNVVASGTITGYAWEVSNDGGVNWNPIGTNAASLQLSNLTVSDNSNLYQVTVIGASPCSSATATGTLSVKNPIITTAPAPATVYPGGSTTFSVTSTAVSPTYQWQYATTTNSGDFVNVGATPAGITYSGAATATLTVNASAVVAAGNNYYYRVLMTSEGCTVASAAGRLTISNYCVTGLTSSGTNTRGIATVTLTNTSDASTFTHATTPAIVPAPWYSLYTGNQLTVKRGQSASAKITLVAVNGNTAAWVDFNKNGTFEASEQVGTSTGNVAASGSSTYTFEIPMNAALGVTRIRLRAGSNGAAANLYAPGDACALKTNGETEDYLLNIIDADPCTGTPVAGIASVSENTLCISGTSVLSVSGFSTGVSGIAMQWFNGSGAITGANDATYTTPVLTASQTYYLQVTCLASGLTAQTAPVTVSVSNPTVAVVPDSRCGSGTLSLGATPESGTVVQWYAAPSGGQPLFVGTPFITPVISSTTSYWAVAKSTSITGQTTDLQLGAGASTSTAVGTSPFNHLYGGQKTQYIIRSSELIAAGFVAGQMKSLGIDISTLGTPIMNGFNIRMGQTAQTVSVSNTPIMGLSTVYSNESQVLTLGINSYRFSSPFTWDGVSNVVVEIVYSNNNSGGTNSAVRTDAVGFTTTGAIYADFVTSQELLDATAENFETTASYTTTTSRPKFIWGFAGYCEGQRTEVVATVTTPPALTLSGSSSAPICSGATTPTVTITSNVADFATYTWSPTAGVIGTELTGYTFNPAVTTTYTLTAVSALGCVNSVNYTVNVNVLPTTLTITPAATANCATAPAVLLTASGATAATVVFTENFNTSAPNWTISNTANSPAATNWAYQSAPYNYSSGFESFVNFTTTDGGNFAVSMADAGSSSLITNTVLTSPSFSTIGLVSATLTFDHIFKFNSVSDLPKVQISTNNGGSWTDLATYTTSQGVTATGAQATTAAVINLTAAHLGHANVKIRYNFVSPWGYYWLIDNVAITGTVQGAVTWAPVEGLYMDANQSTPYNGQATTTVYARPATTTEYVATATLGSGCSTTAATTISVSPATVSGSISGTATICQGETSGLLNLSGYTGTIVRWESTTGVGSSATWATIAGVTGATYTPGVLAQTTRYRAFVKSGLCDELASEEAIITVKQVTAGSLAVIASPTCPNTDGIVTVSGLVPTQNYTITYTKTGIGQVTTPTLIASATGTVTFTVPVSNAAGQTVVVNTLTNTTVGCSLLPTTGNSAVITLEIGCTQVGAQCGQELSAIDSYVYANAPSPGAQSYIWRITTLDVNGNPVASLQPQLLASAIRNIKITQLPVYAFNTSYKVEVSVVRNGVQGPYGQACTVKTPSATTQLTVCDAFLSALNNTIYATAVPFATGYRFTITEVSTGLVATLYRPIRDFKLNMITEFLPKYGNVYRVKVAVRNTDGTYLTDGPECQVTTPDYPVTVIAQSDAVCDAGYQVPAYNTTIYAVSVAGTVKYEFTISGESLMGGSGIQQMSLIKSVRSFTLQEFVNAGAMFTATGVYSVWVKPIFDAAMTSTDLLQIPSGHACTLIAPASARNSVVSKDTFNAVAYPNPFADAFGIKVVTPSDATVSVKVYDMTGRLLEQHLNPVTEMETLQVGDRFPSGVYNVIVTQGDNVKTLRVVKR